MKKFMLFVPIFFVALALIVTTTPLITMSEDISTKVLRMHILANSDSLEDQELKLKVRDKVLELSNEIYLDCNSVDEAIEATKESIDDITTAVQKTIAFYGYCYKADVNIVKEYFSTRKYENLTLPAGEYYSVKITIGEGMGHNWWCVMYPSVCISGCIDDFDSELNDDEKKFITDKYIVKFKVVEIYESIKSAVI